MRNFVLLVVAIALFQFLAFSVYFQVHCRCEVFDANLEFVLGSIACFIIGYLFLQAE